MKKKILASTMASVMALSAGASQLVSFAAVADYKDVLTVTKAELKKFLEDKEIVDLAENDGIDNYGSISGGNFMKAYEYAVAVVDDVDLTDDDATAAFLMIKAAKAALKQYDKKELSALVEQCRSIYDSENILNDNNDAIYKSGDWSDFVEAFEEADGYTDYDDIRITTDAYEKLDAEKNPSKMDTKTKSQINKARQAYEKAIGKEFDFEPWQRGTVSGTGTQYDGLEFAWGALYQHVTSAEATLKAQYDNFDKIKGLTITSNEEIVNAVNDMEMAAKVLDGFKSTMESGNKSKTNKLINTYYGQLVYEYAADDAATIVTNFLSVADSVNDKGVHAAQVNVEGKFVNAPATTDEAHKDKYWNLTTSGKTDYKPLGDEKSASGVYKTLEAELSVRCDDDTIYYLVDTTKELVNGKNPITEISSGVYFQKGSAPTAPDGTKLMTVKKKTAIKLSEIIEVNSSDIRDGLQNAADTAIVTAQKEAKTAIEALYKATVSGGVTSYSGTIADLVTSCTSIKTDANAITAGVTNAAAVSNLASAVTTALAAVTAAAADMETRAGLLIDAITGIDTTTLTTSSVITSAVQSLISGTGATATGAAVSYSESVTSYTNALTSLKAAVKAYNDSANVVSDDKIAANTLASINKLAAAPKADVSSVVSKLNAITPKIVAAGTGFDPAALDFSAYNNVYDSPVGDGATKLKDDKGLKSGHGFSYDTAYTSTKTSGHICHDTTASLYTAMVLFEGFVNYDGTGVTWENIAGLDNNTSIVGEDDSKSISSAAWKLLYNYMKYALEDQFKASSAKTYTKKDVQDLYNKSLTLADDTVETTMFNMSHMDLYNWRNAANNWIKQANSDKSAYKDNETAYDVSVNGASISDAKSTDMYEKLEKSYKQLKKEYDGFKYSYGEIAADMVDIAKEIEANKFNATNAKKLTEDLEAVAAAFVKVEVLQNTADSADEFDESAVFNDDGLLNVHNRLLTSDGLDSINVAGYPDNKFTVAKAKGTSDRNHSHWVMKEAYEKLLADYEEATKAPATDIKDVDANGKFEITDVVALLKLYTDNKMDVAKHDINSDGKVDLQDVTALLKAYTAS